MSSFIENLNAFICSITLQIFKEPVIGSDCYTYERRAITEWLFEHGTSPMTTEPMAIDSLRANLAIKNIMEELSEMFNSFRE